jgi:hypothetical protein
MPLIISPEHSHLSNRIKNIAKDYQILNIDNDVRVCINSIVKSSNFAIIESYNKDIINDLKKNQIFNFALRNYQSNPYFSFHLLVYKNNESYYQNWDELIQHLTEIMMEEVCFASN